MSETTSTTTTPGAEKAAARATFAAVIERLVGRAGTIEAFAARTGVTKSQVNAWLAGKSVPYLRTIVKIAQVWDLDLAVLMTAVGRPPAQQTRDLIAVDPAGSLPMRLAAWRDTSGYTTKAAADIIGITRWELSALISGARQPRSATKIQMIAWALKLSPLTVIDAAYGHDDTSEHVTTLRSRFGPVPQILQAGMYDAGLIHFDDEDTALAAKAMNMTAGRLRDLLNGTENVTLQDALKLNHRFGIVIADLLTAAGTDPDLAARWEIAATEPVKRGPVESVGLLVRSYRTVHNRPLAAVAAEAGYSHHASLLRIENGDGSASPEMLTRIADVLGIPLHRMFAAAKLTPSRAVAA
jgi:transcriptional regulator with XRE-family HTH domain/plasmid maintenance system antidote protein VapI